MRLIEHWIGGKRDPGRWNIGREANRRAERPKRSVAVVVEQFIATTGFDEQHVEVAVVIGVEQRAVDGGPAAAIDMSGRADG